MPMYVTIEIYKVRLPHTIGGGVQTTFLSFNAILSFRRMYATYVYTSLPDQQLPKLLFIEVGVYIMGMNAALCRVGHENSFRTKISRTSHQPSWHNKAEESVKPVHPHACMAQAPFKLRSSSSPPQIGTS